MGIHNQNIPTAEFQVMDCREISRVGDYPEPDGTFLTDLIFVVRKE
jgi:hypothetical protein